MRDDRDHLSRAPLAECEHVLKLDGAPTGDFRVKTVEFGAEAVLRQLTGNPACRFLPLFRARHAVGVLNGEVLRELGRPDAVEIRLQRRCAQGLRLRDREGGHQERNPDEQPGPAVHATVDRPLERPGPRAAPLG